MPACDVTEVAAGLGPSLLCPKQDTISILLGEQARRVHHTVDAPMPVRPRKSGADRAGAETVCRRLTETTTGFTSG